MNQSCFISLGRQLRRCQLVTLVLALTGLTLIPAQAEAQGRFRIFGPRRAADDSLELTQKAGPWLIMCASFDGIDGQQQAKRLATELRKEHKMKAYVFHKTFDIEKQISKRGWGFQEPNAPGEQNLRSSEMKLANDPVKDEFAVLVGDFDDYESVQAQRTLESIKAMNPKSLQSFSREVGDSALAGERLRAQSDALFGNQGGSWETLSNQALNSARPLRFAFLLANPALPEEYFASNQIDEYVIGLNRLRGLKYSLLDNPGQYTIKVATFAGKTYVNEEDMERLKFRKKASDAIIECAKKADILVKYLRSKGIEAYQFHDRYESYVCVGSFDWYQRPDGDRVITNPDALRVVQMFRGERLGNSANFKGFKLPGKLLDAGVTCDANPFAIQVPKVNVRR